MSVTIEELKQNNTISATVEYIAKRAGNAPEDQWVTLLAFHAMENGHTAFPTPVSPITTINWQQSQLIGNEGELKPIIRRKDGFYQLHRFWYEENNTLEWLTSVPFQEQITVDKTWLGLFVSKEVKFVPKKAQMEAIESILQHKRLLLTGGPGTGKTFTIVRMLANLIHHCGYKKEEIVMAAPTGKAASRMAESVRNSIVDLPVSEEIKAAFPESGLTLHRMLGITSNVLQARFNEKNPLPYACVVIDEASMMDINLFFALIKALKPETRLILVGDPDQLPSVEAGNVLADLTEYTSNNNGLKRVHLDESNRFTDNSFIGTLAGFINAGKAEEAWELLKHEQHTLIELNSPKELYSYVSKWYENHLQALQQSETVEEAFKLVKQRIILTGLKVGPFGSEQLNTILKQQFERKANKKWNGFPVIVNRNDYSLDVYNSDIGVYHEQNERIHIAFEAGPETFNYYNPVVLQSLIQPAFALTVHKSQGSEYEEVCLILPTEDAHGLLTRQLLYTGITRAKKRIQVITTKEVFQKAVRNRLQRKTGLAG